MKKTLALFLAAALLLLGLPLSALAEAGTALPLPAENAATALWGDVNGDGKVSSADIIRLKNYLANFDYSTGTSPYALSEWADASGDGKVSSADIIRLKNYLATLDYETGYADYTMGPGGHKHDYKETVLSAATCTKDGSSRLVCSVCSLTRTVTRNALGHDWTGGTCTEPKTCTRCGLVDGKAPGHLFINGVCTRCNVALSSITNTDADLTATYGGTAVTKLPYTSNGLTIESIERIDNTISLVVTNNTGIPIGGFSYFTLKCFDAQGNVLHGESVRLWCALNPGEHCRTSFSFREGTKRIIFGEATLYSGDIFPTSGTTAIYGNYEITKAPFTIGGLKVESISVDGNKITLTVVNKTGYAISESSRLYCREYDADGLVLGDDYERVKGMSNGANCTVTFTAASTATKVLFGTAYVEKGEEFASTETAVYDGITFTKLPYTSGGITVQSVSVDRYGYATFKIKNNTGGPISNYSYIRYQMYDSDGYSLRTSDLYTLDLDAGESCYRSFYLADGTVKLYFGATSVKAGTDFPKDETVTVNGMTYTKLPHTSNGLTVDSIGSFDKYGYATIKITNNTGGPVSDTSYFTFKCFDKDGVVLAIKDLGVTELNAGESYVTTISVPTATTKFLFWGATVRTGTTFPTSTTTSVSGYQVTKLPHTTNGLKINTITIADEKATVNVTNNTGKSLSASTYFKVKFYDASGNVLKVTYVSTPAFVSGESCVTYFYIPSNTAKILIGEAKLYEQ